MLVPLFNFITEILQLLIWIILIQAILSWLVAFNVINLHNQFVRAVWDGLNRLLDPLLRPIRRVIPDLGGIDLSPMVLVLGILFIQRVVLPTILLAFGM